MNRRFSLHQKRKKELVIIKTLCNVAFYICTLRQLMTMVSSIRCKVKIDNLFSIVRMNMRMNFKEVSKRCWRRTRLKVKKPIKRKIRWTSIKMWFWIAMLLVSCKWSSGCQRAVLSPFQVRSPGVLELDRIWKKNPPLADEMVWPRARWCAFTVQC